MEKCFLLRKVGSDIFGKNSIENIKKEGIDVSGISTDPEAASGVAQIIVDKKGENSIVVAPGANNKLNREDIDNAEDQIRQADILLMQLEIPIDTILYAAKKAHSLGKKVILNPAPAVQLPDDLFESLYMITPNENETELLTNIKVTNQSSAAEAAKSLKNRGVMNVIITMGSKGAYVHTDELKQIVPAFDVQAVDTTAAGDCFSGTLAVEIGRGMDMIESVRYANRAASIAVTRPGAQASLPNRKEVESSL